MLKSRSHYRSLLSEHGSLASPGTRHSYPAELAQVMSERLEQLCHTSGVDVSGLIESTSE